jgi:hypothetical protein
MSERLSYCCDSIGSDIVVKISANIGKKCKVQVFLMDFLKKNTSH